MAKTRKPRQYYKHLGQKPTLGLLPEKSVCLSLKELAIELDVCTRTLYEWIQRGYLTIGTRVGGRWRFPIKDVRKWVETFMVDNRCQVIKEEIPEATYEDLEAFNIDNFFSDDKFKEY